MSCSFSVTRAFAVPGLLLLLSLAAVLSLVIGAKPLPAAVVLEAFTGMCQSADCTIVLDARLPRTLAGLLAGGALGLAGALMQTLTRNPLADPGILGVNNGASFAIVLGAALFGFSTPLEQLFMAFSGALISSLIVAFTGSQGGGQLSPVRLTLAGVALGAVLEGLTSGIALLNPEVYDQLRFWQAGSLDIRSLQTLKVALAPVVIAGIVALFLSRALNSLSLGSDTATALGSKVARTQLIGLLAITVLCGIIRPIKAIGPTSAVALPHKTVIASKPISWVRATLLPSAVAVSLPRLRLFSARLRNSATIPAITTGASATFNVCRLRMSSDPACQKRSWS